MRLPIFLSSAVFATMVAGQAFAEVRIGLAAPLSGPSAILGEQMKAGAVTATARLRDPAVTLLTADDGCTADGGAKAARQFVDAKVAIVVGFLCTESIEAALPILSAADIPVINIGVRADSLTDARIRTGWQVYRLGPRADSEREATARIMTRLWQDALFAIVDDGTIYGRELVESFRLASEQAGLKPVFTDTYRPQSDNQIGLVGRLKRAGATHVLVGGDRDDIAIMGRDARQLDADLLFAGGEALLASSGDVPLAAGTLMVGLPEPKVADPALQSALDDAGIAAEGYVLPGYAAIEIARAAFADPLQAKPALADRDFDTVVGKIRFTISGDLAENPYRLMRFDGGDFKLIEQP